jgi:hypothetical protein
MADKPKIEKAPKDKLNIAISQLQEIDEAIQNDPDSASDFVLKFMGGDPETEKDGMMDRLEAFGENIFLSLKQCEMIHKIHAEIVLGEEPQRTKTVKTNRYLKD